MEIITTATAATTAKSNAQSRNAANNSYSKSLMASRALQSNGTNNEVNISQLEKGDVFKGEITNMTGKTVTVSLGNGQVLTAALLEPVPINIGNNLYFEVKENDGERITIRPLLDEKFSPQNQTIEKSLQSAGLQLNEKNMAVVKELMDASLPIDRNSIMKILQHSLNHPDASIKDIVTMVRLGLPVTEGNLSQLGQYQNHTNQLASQMEGVMNSITTAYEELSQEGGSAGKVIQFNQMVVDTFTTTQLKEPLPVTTLQEAFFMEEDEVADFYKNASQPELDAAGNPIVDAEGRAFPKGSLVLTEAGTPLLDPQGNLVVSDSFLNELKTQFPDMSQEALLQAFRDGQFNISGKNAFTSEIQNAFAEQLKSLGINEDAIKIMLDPKNTAEDLFRSIHDYVSNNSELSPETVKQFFASKEYQVLIESVIDHQWKLTPEQLKEPAQLHHLFERMSEQTSKLADAAMSFSSSSGGQQMGEQAQNMYDNLKFIQDLNEKYTYAQIPLQLTNQDANSELYVYTNKKSLSKDKKNISVLLHLDMDHLGSTDVHVQLNGTQVMARFYLEDNRSVSTVKNHIEQLQEQIAGLNLTLSTEVVRRADKKEMVEDIVEDFLAKDIPSNQQIKRYTFDMRA